MTVQAAILQGAKLLEEAGVLEQRLTAEVLLAHAMRCERPYLYAHSNDELTELAWIHYGRYLNERLQGKPTQYITRKQEFYGRDFLVTADVLIPRPETEHLVEAAIAFVKNHSNAKVLDVGCGSGAIAISLSLETGVTVCGCDISLAALNISTTNRNRLHAKVPLFAGDLATAVKPASLDLLVSNPPYVPGADRTNMQREVRDWEPHVALFAGPSGLEIYERLVAQTTIVVKPKGRLMMELGYQSLDAVREMLTNHWSNLDVLTDLAGLPRVIVAERI